MNRIRVILFLVISAVFGMKNNNNIELQFNENHEYTIVQFTDLHYGEKDSSNLENNETQETILNAVKPDMVVVTGDSVSGYAWDGKSQTFYQDNWKIFSSSFVKYKTPYAYTFGNHDTQANLTPQKCGELDKTNPYSLFAGDPSVDSESLSNYYLELKSAFQSSKSGADKPISMLLWLFDTKTTGCNGISQSWGCINKAQLDWYTKTQNKINEMNKQQINGLAFFHIPPVESLYLWNFGLTYGQKNESVNCPMYDTGVIARFMQSGNIKGVFVGHDHNNDFAGYYGDIELVYGRKTGKSGYGPVMGRGARVIKLKETITDDGVIDFEYQHYIVNHLGQKLERGPTSWQGWKSYRETCAFI